MPEEGRAIRMEPWTSLDELSNPYDSYRISFAYPDGTAGKVEIPRAGATAEAVSEAIDEEIKLWHEIMGR